MQPLERHKVVAVRVLGGGRANNHGVARGCLDISPVFYPTTLSTPIYIYIFFLSCFSVCFFQSSEIYGTSRIRRSTPCCVSYSTRNTQMSNRPELCPCCRTPGRLPRGKVQRRHTKREHHIIISLRSCRRPRRSSPCACSAREGVHTPRTAPLSSWYHMYIYISGAGQSPVGSPFTRVYHIP